MMDVVACLMPDAEVLSLFSKHGHYRLAAPLIANKLTLGMPFNVVSRAGRHHCLVQVDADGINRFLPQQLVGVVR